MRNIILFDETATRENFLPITFTRPVSDIRFGILTIRQKWEKAFPGTYSYATAEYLSIKYPRVEADRDNDYHIAGNVCPTPEFVTMLENLHPGQAVTCKGKTIAYRGENPAESLEIAEAPLAINMLPDIFMLNEQALLDDFMTITPRAKSSARPAP